MTPVNHKPTKTFRPEHTEESDKVGCLAQAIRSNAGKIAATLLALPAIGAAAWQYGPSAVDYLMRVNEAAKQVGTLKADIQAVKDDVSSLKQDVGAVKGDVKDVKGDVAGVKAETKKTGEDVAYIKGWIQGQDRPVRATARTNLPEN